jgi:Zn ribbon nucleic-acid-binding protein
MQLFEVKTPAWKVIRGIKCPRCLAVVEIKPHEFIYGEESVFGIERCPHCGMNMQSPNPKTHRRFNLSDYTRVRIDMTYADLNSSHGDGYTVEDLDLSSAMLSYGLSTGYYEVHFGGDNCDEPFIWVPKEDVKKFTAEDWDLLGIPMVTT